MADKKYYWLKLKRDFFKRHDVRIVEELPNGKEYLLFYLKLLVESIDHEGELRFSDTIPYNEQMLSVITNTNIDVVRSAMKLFVELKMVEVLSDETIYVAEVNNMIGSETKWAEKKRIQRQRDNVPMLSSNCPTEIEKDKEIEQEQDKEKYKRRFTKPTLEEVKAYCYERNKGVDPEKWFNYYSSNGWKVGKNPMKDWKAAVRTWERGDTSGKSKRNDFTPYPDEY